MAFDLQEQEQIAELKAWWQDWGRYLAVAVVAGLVGYAGWQGWSSYQEKQAHAAAEIYVKVEVLGATDAAKLRPDVEKLQNEYAGTGYAARATLLLAKAFADAGDFKSATTQLQWVAGHADEAGLRDAARLRIAAVALDQKQYDAALAALQGREEEASMPLFSEMRGDIMIEKGDVAGARDAYKQTLAKLEKGAPNYQFVEVKLAALGNS
ncbi:YfgM family protein [Andreprevotia chitinilytica]|uniref:YfgM family protein n=1 Tax=Andreprevotia chitinilytica TaxID=396808 RepID=UPI00055580F8|nr:tetratricopeptide repeat protein [Andreprevotia chitinilytica]